MSGFIPREKLTAYQRWELAAFDEEEAEDATEVTEVPVEEAVESPPPDDDASTPVEVTEQPVLTLPTAADIERIHDEAREQGRAEGHADGYAAGHAEGYAAGSEEGQTRAREGAARIAEILENLEQAAGTLEQSVADQLLNTAVEIAHQVVRQSLRIRPELLLPVVREAVAALQPGSGRLVLRVHPDDVALIREHMGEQLLHNDWRIVEDPSLTRGGCRVELGASDVDATVETRWKQVIETLGLRRDWLAGDERAEDERRGTEDGDGTGHR
jgi:flagellar assembly protein FliH